MGLLQQWSKNSQLRTNGKWHNFAVEVIGKVNADSIESDRFGGGNQSCLQSMLRIWYDSTTDHSWQKIIDALTKMKEFRLIESIEEQYLRCM